MEGRIRKKCKNGIVLWGKGRKFGFVDYNGKVILPMNYKSIQCDDSNGNLIVSKGKNKKGIFNILNGFLLDTTYTKITEVSQSNLLYLIKSKNESFLYSLKDEKKIIECESAKIVDNNILVRAKRKYGLVNFDGDILSDIKWERFNKLIPGVYVISVDRKQALLNSVGKQLTPFEDVNYKKYKFNYIEKRMKDGSKQYYDSNLNDILAEVLEFDIINRYWDFIIVKNRLGKFGVLNTKMEVVLPYSYDDVKYVKEKYFIVKEGNRTGLIEIK